MFDPVTDEVLRRRRLGAAYTDVTEQSASMTSLICSVCKREIRPEEQVFWVSDEVHCFQCHSMLDYEYDKERKDDVEMRKKGTRWIDAKKD
jgi:hypothetical protein